MAQITLVEARWSCSRQRDDGWFEDVIVETLDEKKACEEDESLSCECSAVMTTCLIGPDSRGSFTNMKVRVTYAKNCDRESCICAIHDNWVAIAEERIDTAITHKERKEEIIKQFEEELAEQGLILIDETVAPEDGEIDDNAQGTSEDDGSENKTDSESIDEKVDIFQDGDILYCAVGSD